ncbi:MAG TPA: carbohydrate kinase family protein [Methanomassiliicoccales archaeon]|nr:carbohydrate kinase family protein [Methanomassiliicoccales archaeon]
MSPFLCVYGHTNLDYILSLNKFPDLNTSVNVESKITYYGGTAANVATISAALGTPSALCSYVGADFPPGFRQLMEAKGVDLRDLVMVPGHETPTVWVVSDREHNQVAYVYQGPMGTMEGEPLLLNAARESEWVHVMTGRPPYYLRLMKECRRLGKRIAFDPAQEIHNVWKNEWFSEAMNMADAFFCNENELRTALKYMGKKRPEELLDHVGLLVNTIGPKGSVVYAKEGRVEVPAVKPKRIVDTTGAGDAFRAGFFSGLYRGANLRESAVIGATVSSFVIEERGSLTNIPSWTQVEERASGYL